MNRFLFFVGVSFFVLQFILIIYSQFYNNKHFCWAPHNTQVKYSFSGKINGVDFTDSSFKVRYHIPIKGWEAHSPDNIKDIILAKERQMLYTDTVLISLDYSENGNALKNWEYATDF
jgi:hypothetical protein